MSYDVPPAPKEIKVERIDRAFRIVVDGKPFPFPVEDLTTEVADDRFPSITVTIPAESVRIVNSLRRRDE